MLPHSDHPSISRNQLLTNQFSRKSAITPDDPIPIEASGNQANDQGNLPITESPLLQTTISTTLTTISTISSTTSSTTTLTLICLYLNSMERSLKPHLTTTSLIQLNLTTMIHQNLRIPTLQVAQNSSLMKEGQSYTITL